MAEVQVKKQAEAPQRAKSETVFKRSEVPQEKKYIFRLLEPRRYKTLPKTNLVYDENTNRQRHIRLIDGVDTFWKDEQDERKIDNNIASSQAWLPEFHESFLVLTSPIDDQKIEYLMLLDAYDRKKVRLNSSKPPIFTLENYDGKEQDEFAFMKSQKQAIDLAWKAIEDESDAYLAHAKYLGVSFKDGYGNDRLPSSIQKDYVGVATSNPALFIKTYSSPVVKIQYMVTKAIELGIVDAGNHVKGQAHWGDSKAFITTLDVSKTPIEDLANFANTDQGTEFLAALKMKLEQK
jgi:hypothetical protein